MSTLTPPTSPSHPNQDTAAGSGDTGLYRRFQHTGAELSALLGEAERRARAAGDTTAATGYLRQQVAVEQQRRYTHPGDRQVHQRALAEWSAHAALLRAGLSQSDARQPPG